MLVLFLLVQNRAQSQICSPQDVIGNLSSLSSLGSAGVLPSSICALCAPGSTCVGGRCQCLDPKKMGSVCQYDKVYPLVQCSKTIQYPAACQQCFQYLASMQDPTNNQNILTGLKNFVKPNKDVVTSIVYFLGLGLDDFKNVKAVLQSIATNKEMGTYADSSIDCRQGFYCAISMGGKGYIFVFSGQTFNDVWIRIPVFPVKSLVRRQIYYTCKPVSQATLLTNATSGLGVNCSFNGNKTVLAGDLVFEVTVISQTKDIAVPQQLQSSRIENVFGSFGVVVSFCLVGLLAVGAVLLFCTKFGREEEEEQVLLRSLHPFFSIAVKGYLPANQALLLLINEVALLGLIQSFLMLYSDGDSVRYFLLSLPVIPIETVAVYLIGFLRQRWLRNWFSLRVVVEGLQLAVIIFLLWLVQDTRYEKASGVGFIINLVLDLGLSGVTVLFCSFMISQGSEERVQSLLRVLQVRGFIVGMDDEDDLGDRPSLTDRILRQNE